MFCPRPLYICFFSMVFFQGEWASSLICAHCHDILCLLSRPKAMELVDHRPKLLNQWTKLHLSIFNYFVSVDNSWQTRTEETSGLLRALDAFTDYPGSIPTYMVPHKTKQKKLVTTFTGDPTLLTSIVTIWLWYTYIHEGKALICCGTILSFILSLVLFLMLIGQ